MSSIKEQLETLVALQRAETEIKRIEQELEGIEGRIESLNSEVLTCEKHVSDSQAALDELRKQFADIAILAAEKVIKESLDKEKHRKVIDEVLDESNTLQ